MSATQYFSGNKGSTLIKSEVVLKRIEVMFFLFLLLILVRLSFGEGDSVDSRLAREAGADSGDFLKQMTYLLAFCSFTMIWLMTRGLRFPQSLSRPQIFLVGWVLCSSFWAFDHAVSVRRSLLLAFVVFTMAFATDLLGVKRTFKVLYAVLAFCMTMSLVAVFLVPSIAVHPPTEIDQSIVGGWRGFFTHKNTAGGVCALAVIMFLHHAIDRGKLRDWFFLGVCVTFLLGCGSKTPLGLVAVVIPVGLIYRISWKSAAGKMLYMLGFILAAMLTIIVATGYSTKISDVFSDPESFTGRVAIWRAALRFWQDHWLFGSGYSSLWATSITPPIMPYADFPFLEFIVHSHNGYIEMLATTGVPGFTLAVVSAVFIPAYQLITKVSPKNANFFSMLFSMWFFCLLENCMETQLYTRDREMWIVMFTVILSLQLQTSTSLIPSAMRTRRLVRNRHAPLIPQASETVTATVEDPGVKFFS